MANEPALEIRRATREDLDALAALRPSVHDTHARAQPDFFKPTSHEGARREAEAWLGRENTWVLLASLDGEPVGYLLAMIFDRPESELSHARRILYIDQIAVMESARGRGCGKRLLEAGIALARELGLAIVELDVWHFNADARAFFVSQGFAMTRERLTQVLK